MTCDMPEVQTPQEVEEPVVDEPEQTTPDVNICPEPQIVYVDRENNSSLYQKFDWWAENTAPTFVKVLWSDKYLLLGVILAILVLLYMLSRPKKRKPVPIPKQKPPIDPRLARLHKIVVALLQKGEDKYSVIEYFKRRHVNDEDLEKVFKYIET